MEEVCASGVPRLVGAPQKNSRRLGESFIVAVKQELTRRGVNNHEENLACDDCALVVSHSHSVLHFFGCSNTKDI
jgi:hypothetical protein